MLRQRCVGFYEISRWLRSEAVHEHSTFGEYVDGEGEFLLTKILACRVEWNDAEFITTKTRAVAFAL